MMWPDCASPQSAFVLALLALSIGVVAAQPRESPSADERLELRIEPLVDLHYFVLAHSLEKGPGPDWMRAAVEAARSIGSAAPLDRAWAMIDVSIAVNAPALDEIRASISRLPDRAIRESAARYLTALEAIQPAFVRDVWPGHHKAIAAATAAVRAALAGKQQLAIAFIAYKLALRDPGGNVPVFLVAEGPFPGAFTRRARGGGGIVFADVTRFSTPLLVDTLLHEAVHALDLASPGGQSVLERLRAQLAAAGLPATHPGFRDVPHTVMFVQAGETVRRLIDPAYDPYAHDYYSRVPVTTSVVKAAWLAHLDGRIPQAEAIRRMVSEFMAAKDRGR